MQNKIVLGVDIGGSHITAKLVDLESGVTIEGSEIRRLVNSNGTAEEIINNWCQVIEEAFNSKPVTDRRIGIAMPGPFDYENGIAWMQNQQKYDALYGLNVRDLLAQKLGILPGAIKFINDAESFLKGEVFSGAAKSCSSAIGFTLGTGFGSAYYQNGKVEDADLWCSPYKDGIAEDYLSTRWFIKRYYELSGNTIEGVKELADLKNDNDATRVFIDFGRNMAMFLNGLITQRQPQVIVIGGNISRAFPLFLDSLVTTLNKGAKEPEIRKAILGEDASLVGAASCWIITCQEEKSLLDK